VYSPIKPVGLLVLAPVVYLGAAFCYAGYVPSLPVSKARELIARAPEFNRYAHLVTVASVNQGKESMDSLSYGRFMFQFRNAPSDAAAIPAVADFRYSHGAWRLHTFDYGCPSDCRQVTVYNPPEDDSHPFRDMLLFRPI
jgi:hypothetical protein